MGIARKIWSKLKPLLPVLGEFSAPPSIKQAAIDSEIRLALQDCTAQTPDNPVLSGFKVYSQVDEDGIIQELCRRIGISEGNFIELGCGNGSENNSHYLLLRGWSGVWVDGSWSNIKNILNVIPADSKRLLVQQFFITRENIASYVKAWDERLSNKVDLLSIDIDGNDALVLAEILNLIQPKIVVAEYNGKFPPPLRTSVAYDPKHSWQGDDYYGSSLQVYVDLLKNHQLVTCNVSGANAFFVHKDLCKKFTKYSVEQLFMPARNHLVQRRGAAPASLKYLRDVILSAER